MGGDSAALVREVLEEYGGDVRRLLRTYLRPPEPRSDVYEFASDYPERGGRTLRASLCIAAARAHGANLEQVLNSAVALELVHNAFLIHDDIEDESEERRGRPTLHRLLGVPIAVNVGDALIALSLRPLLANRHSLGPRLSMRILEEAERMVRETVEGQALELSWRHANVLQLETEDYLRMILKKTCWYTSIYPCRVGAVIGTRDGAALDCFTRFGFFLGAAFQIQDDLLNLDGDPVRYGKELGGDVWEGKRTLMLIHASNHAEPPERLELRRILALERAARTPDDVRWVTNLMRARGSIDYARTLGHALAGAACHEFHRSFGHLPDSRDKRFLEALPSWVIERT